MTGSEGTSDASASKPTQDYAPDWSESAVATTHIWNPTKSSGDLCYCADTCQGGESIRKCAVCKIICHEGCMNILALECRPSFIEKEPRAPRAENPSVKHHWVIRKRLDAQCKQCKKSTSKSAFSSKEPNAIQCSWCKMAYHEDCRPDPSVLGGDCKLGEHHKLIMPPHCICKVKNRSEFNSSLRRSSSNNPGKSTVSQSESSKDDDSSKPIAVAAKSKATNQSPFVVISNENEDCKPLIVFLNPKSGGNQGRVLFKKFQYLLNPRQVFDLTKGGPDFGLEMYRNVNNLHILACGGDGTAGWVMSVIDKLNFKSSPPIAVLPLGTGNDLARVLNWGPKFKLNGYANEPLCKILKSINNGTPTQLDRWDLLAEPASGEGDKQILPLNVFNNYFSLGVDAAVALKFHESREANPERFNSRLYNKYFYLKAGGEKMVFNDLRDLKDQITLECDGKNYSKELENAKPHVILFLNIPSYSAGTNPWGRHSDQSFNDKKLEVIALTSLDLASIHLQMAGTRLCQCTQAVVTTRKSMPVQVDGEPREVEPAKIIIRHRNQACMIMKRKRQDSPARHSDENLK